MDPEAEARGRLLAALGARPTVGHVARVTGIAVSRVVAMARLGRIRRAGPGVIDPMSVADAIYPRPTRPIGVRS